MRGFPVAICAPSGVGKTTVARALLQGRDDLVFSVSVTTRAPRPEERPGVDYEFVDRDHFEALIRDGQLLEWAEVHGELYGTPLANLREAEESGKVLILDIDVQGAEQVVAKRSDTVTIFLLPPSFETLMSRLRARGSEDPARLRRRMESARAELVRMDDFRYVVVNDRLEDTLDRIHAILGAEGQRLDRRAAEVEPLRREIREGLERELS